MICKDLSKSLGKCCTVLAITALLSAYGSDSGGAAATSTTPATTPPATTTPVTPASVSFETDIQPIFNVHCISCHKMGGSASVLVLDSGAYKNLVGRPAATSAGTLVIRGDSVNSVLIDRISGHLADNLLQMPLGGPFLSTSDQDLIKTWIDEGAKEN